MLRPALILTAALLSTPIAAQTAPQSATPAVCPEGTLAAPDGACLATRGLGGKGGTDGKDAGGTKGGAGSDPKGGGGLTGTAGNPDI